MAELIDGAAAGYAFQSERTENRRESAASEDADQVQGFSIPSRGIVVAVLVSGFLWTALILGARAVWLLVR